jgi:hypothetical protein
VIGELSLYGVFVPALLVWAFLAVLATVALRTILRPIGFYRLVWHPALFDVAIFVILLGGVVALASQWAPT